MRLQGEARTAGGRVEVLLGNHDALILAALGFGGSFAASWRRNGGVDSDLARLDAPRAEWVSALPALALVGQTLYAHADATFYTRYGETIPEVNAAFRELWRGDDAVAWDGLLDDFSERRAFGGPGGAATVARFLSRYGGRRLVHGHTPIQKATGRRPERVVSAHEYAGGLCVNVDSGMYLGGPGFVYEAPDPYGDAQER